MSYSPTVYLASMVTPRLRLGGVLAGHPCAGPPGSAGHQRHGRRIGQARVRVEVFDETRRRVGVEMVDERPVADVDLLAPQERRHRHDDGELLQAALIVVGHRQHRPIAVAHEHDLRGAVEQLGISLGDVEAAEAKERRRRPDDQRCERECRHDSFHWEDPFESGVARGLNRALSPNAPMAASSQGLPRPVA